MLGVILVVLGTAMRLLTRHPAGRITSLGLDVSAAGIAFGLVVLMVFAFTRIGASGWSRSSAKATDRRNSADRQQSAASQRHAQGRLRASAPSGGDGHAGRNARARSARPQVLDPTTVYSPRGLLDVPRQA